MPSCFSDLLQTSATCPYRLHQLQHVLHLSFIKPLSMCHSPHMTGMCLTRCMSLDCSSASLILGSNFTGSRPRNAWTTYSASLARKVTQPWYAGFLQRRPTNVIWRNSSTTSRAPQMMKSLHECTYMSLRTSRRGLMNQLMSS